MFRQRSFFHALAALMLGAGGLGAATLSLGPVAVPVNGSADASLSLQSQGAQITLLQFDLEYDETALRITAEITGAAQKAGKDVSVNGKTYVIAGLNQTAIGDGSVLLFHFIPKAGAAGSFLLKVRNVVAGDKDGNAVALTASDVTVTVGANSVGPVITAVTHGSSFQPVIAGSTWITIFGSNLAPRVRLWTLADFNGNKLPTSLDGVSVFVNGKPAYIYYINPAQVNVLSPEDDTVGPVTVQVVTPDGQASASVTKKATAPAFFMLPQEGGKYIAAFHIDGTIVGKPGLIPGVVTRPAKPGEILTFYGTGFGRTDPAVATGELLAAPVLLASPGPTVRFGGSQGEVLWGGLISSGLAQLNVRLPADLKDGDVAVVARAGTEEGAAAGAFITISTQ